MAFLLRMIGTLLMSGFLLAGCKAAEEAPLSDIVSDVGTVRYVDLEGGFYGIVTERGERYLPMNLDEEFQKDGLDLRFRARVAEGVMTTQMWGQPVEIIEAMEVTFME